MENCEYTIKYNDFAIIFIGAGVGWFLIGYFCMKALTQIKNNNNNNNQEILFAQNI